MDSKQQQEDWMNRKWRPAMGWMYMLICLLDMAVFPVLWSVLQVMNHQPQITQWNPLTLQGAGLFHIAMGAVLGIAAFGRTQEKLAGTAANPTTGGNNGFPTATTNSVPSSGGFGSVSSGFGSPTPSASGFGSTPSATPAPATTGFGASTSSAPIATTASGKKIVPTDPDPVL